MEECHDRLNDGLGLGSGKKKPSFFGKTRFLSDISRYKAGNHSEDTLGAELQTGDKGLCSRWCQHLRRYRPATSGHVSAQSPGRFRSRYETP